MIFTRHANNTSTTFETLTTLFSFIAHKSRFQSTLSVKPVVTKIFASDFQPTKISADLNFSRQQLSTDFSFQPTFFQPTFFPTDFFQPTFFSTVYGLWIDLFVLPPPFITLGSKNKRGESVITWARVGTFNFHEI